MIWLYFTSPYCGPCKFAGPKIKAFTEKHKIELRTLDVEDTLGDRLANRLYVHSLPTIIVYAAAVSKKGELARLTGWGDKRYTLDDLHLSSLEAMTKPKPRKNK